MKRTRNGQCITTEGARLEADVEATQLKATKESVIFGHVKIDVGATVTSAATNSIPGVAESSHEPVTTGAGKTAGSKPAFNSLSRVSDRWRRLVSDVAVKYPVEIALPHWRLRDILVLLQTEEASWQSTSIAPASPTVIDWTHADGSGPVNAPVRALWLACVKECCAILGADLVTPIYTPSQCKAIMDVLSVLSAGIKAIEPIITSMESQPASFDVHAIAGYDSLSSTPGATLTLRFAYNRESIACRVTQQTSISKIVTIISNHYGFADSNKLRFLFEGRRLDEDGSVRFNRLTDGDVVHILEEQTGD